MTTRSNQERSNQDRELRQRNPIDLSAGAKPEFEELEIITDPLAMSAVEELAFMEEPLTIMIARGREEHSPTSIPVGVNGEQLSVPVGIACIIKRKFVEVLFSSRSENVETVVEDVPMDGTTEKRNMMKTWAIPRFSVSILQDKSGIKGQQWLENMMQG